MLFGFTPDETEVSESCGSEVMRQNQNTEAERQKVLKVLFSETPRGCTVCTIWQSQLYRKSLWWSGGCDRENRLTSRAEEVVGSQVQCGAFHILLPLTLWKQIPRRGSPQTVDCLRQSEFTRRTTTNCEPEAVRGTWCRNVAKWQRITGREKPN